MYLFFAVYNHHGHGLVKSVLPGLYYSSIHQLIKNDGIYVIKLPDDILLHFCSY